MKLYIVTCPDEDNYLHILAVWSSQALAEGFVEKFKEAHKDDPFWQLDDIVIWSVVLNESRF